MSASAPRYTISSVGRPDPRLAAKLWEIIGGPAMSAKAEETQRAQPDELTAPRAAAHPDTNSAGP